MFIIETTFVSQPTNIQYHHALKNCMFVDTSDKSFAKIFKTEKSAESYMKAKSGCGYGTFGVGKIVKL